MWYSSQDEYVYSRLGQSGYEIGRIFPDVLPKSQYAKSVGKRDRISIKKLTK